jgi:uncharacterized protein YfdQ (DUF2303 family)
MPELTNASIKDLLNAGAQPVVRTLDAKSLQNQEIPLLLIPDGDGKYSYALLPQLEKYLPDPLRKTGQVLLDDAESFIWYLKEHGNKAATNIYLQAKYESGDVSFLGIINDDETGKPAWRDHKARFIPKKSVEWTRWTSRNGQAMSQIDFANWIEDNIGDITTVEGMPTGAQMLEMALNFEAASEKRFKSGARLQSGGISLEYVDTDDDATRSKMAMFERFSLGLRVLQGGEAYEMSARLKYRIRDGGLSIWFELIRPDKVLEAATKDIVEKIKNESGFTLLLGSPAE